MTNRITYLAIALGLSCIANTASAACVAEYKAKQDSPLRLEHNKVQISGPCTKDAVKAELEAALAAKGWTLLKVLSVSDE